MPKLEMRRTGWDIALGALLVVAGLVILGNAAFATEVSVLFIGWMLVIYGAIALAAAFFLIGKGGFWSASLSGALMVVLGLLFLRNTGAAALTLTLLAGVMFLTAGIVRLMAAFHDPLFRVPLVLSGVACTILGLIVLFDLFDATYVLLGTLLGVYCIVDGITMMAIGRWRVVRIPESATEAGGVATPASQAHVDMPGQRKPSADKAQEQRRTQPH
jgi:uncharacterized membrane protein HdeD (DUF308 family)